MRSLYALLFAVGMTGLAQAQTPQQVAAAKRSGLEVAMLRMCEATSPQQHGIQVKTIKVKSGYRMRCVHSFYNQFTMDYGSVNPAFQRFWHENRTTLAEAQVTQIGVYGTGEFAEGSYLKLD